MHSARRAHEHFIDAEVSKRLAAFGLLIFLAHRSPDIRVHDIGAGDRLTRIAREPDVRLTLRATQYYPSGIVSLRASESEREASRAAASIHELAMLFPSPTHATTLPRCSPRCCRTVMTSASTWQGW